MHAHVFCKLLEIKESKTMFFSHFCLNLAKYDLCFRILFFVSLKTYGVSYRYKRDQGNKKG